MERYVCIHGHFYQPPRENPWLEAVELQDSAYPYHDWNERISAECYAPNSASRILDGEQRILDIVSNYAKISFNFGPTLLMWMEQAAPELYRSIQAADAQSREWRSGHGAAIAQVYNHMIMPLANDRDRETQVVWGIGDFRHRFGRDPEGMWLAETAVDLETLEILARHDIRYTILAPRQAARFRALGEEDWTELDEAGIDPTRAYLCRLPSGGEIALFFYDGPISQAVAFENLLNSGETFAARLVGGFSDDREWPQLLHIATDGESYGHHHRFGDMALASALNHIEKNSLARVTNYGEYLELHPPQAEVEIRENTSWSCAHGLERWRSDCGCNSGGYAWNQEWRGPLRAALDWLRDQLAGIYEREGGMLLRDPWAARDGYIQVVLDRSDESIDRFLAAQCVREPDGPEKVRLLKLLEIQRHAMLMYTSCGWFFDELSGIETVQVIQYAGRTLQLASEIIRTDLENGFLDRLKEARSNIPEHGNGAVIYEKFVRPARIDLTKVAVHFGFSSLFRDYEERTRIFSYDVDLQNYDRRSAEDITFATGTVTVTSRITKESDDLMFGVVRFGRHDFRGGVSRCPDDATCGDIRAKFAELFEKGFFTSIVGLMDSYFGSHSYSLLNLFRDEQREILNRIIRDTLEKFREDYRSMYEHGRFLMEFIQDTGMPVPEPFLMAARSALAADIKEALTSDDLDTERVGRIIANMRRWQVEANAPDIEIVTRRRLEVLVRQYGADVSDQPLLEKICTTLKLAQDIPLTLNTWDLQNLYYAIARKEYGRIAALSGEGGETPLLQERFQELGERLGMNLDSVLPPVATGPAAAGAGAVVTAAPPGAQG